jgi:hypothetical protein
MLAMSAVLKLPAASAHHGPYGQYDLENTIEFTGQLVAIEWVNPHAVVLVQTTIDGVESTLRIELQSLSQLKAKGWRGDELQVGTTVRVVNAAREYGNGATGICCARIYDLNGREFYTDPRRSEQDSGAGGFR